MDIKKVLALIESAEQPKQALTEGKNMAKDMVMQHYTKQEIKTPVRNPINKLNEYFKVVNNEMLNVIKEEQDAKRIEVKSIVNRVLSRLDESKKQNTAKPRNFVAKNAINTGAGAHKDKKKAAKQGDVKHKNKEQELAEKSKNESVAGPKKCWPGHRKVGTQPGTGKNKGKRVNDCEKIKEAIEVGSPVKVYSNVLKKAVFGTVVALKENKAYVNYNNTKIVMAHPVETIQINEVGAAMAGKLIPGLGLAAGGYDAYQRAKQGDYIGAGLSGAAGLASLVPGLGTAAATGLLGAQLGRDKARTGSFLPSYDEIGQAGKKGQNATPAGKWPTSPEEIKAYQKANGLAADGLIGKMTLKSLTQAGIKPPEGFKMVGDKNNKLLRTPSPSANAPATGATTTAPSQAATPAPVRTTNTSSNTSVQGTLKMGQPSGPITYNGKVVQPDEPEYAAAAKALIDSQARSQASRAQMRMTPNPA